MDLTVLRHPRPVGVEGLCYGRLDVALGPTADNEIACAVAQLGDGHAVLASPSQRCRKLAQALGRNGSVRFDYRLMELNFGAWEGRSWADIDRTESDPWAGDPWHLAPPDGETFEALHARVSDVLANLTPGSVIVSHAGPVRAMRMITTGATFAEVFAETVPYASPIRFGVT